MALEAITDFQLQKKLKPLLELEKVKKKGFKSIQF